MANHLQKIWPGGETKWKDFIREKNASRNSAKHLNDQKTLTADLEEAACWMLVRALANRRLLELPELGREREFDDWFYENVVGV